MSDHDHRVEGVDAEEADAPLVDEVLHRADHPMVGEVLGPAGLAGEDQHGPAPVAVTDHAETVVRPGHLELDAVALHGLILAYASNLARRR